MKLHEVFVSKKRDIVVTIPRSKLAEIGLEEAEVAEYVRQKGDADGMGYYWAMGRLPKDDVRRIYFAWDGAVRAYHEVTEVDRAGKRIYMRAEIHDVKPVPIESFRGFRYYEGE